MPKKDKPVSIEVPYNRTRDEDNQPSVETDDPRPNVAQRRRSRSLTRRVRRFFSRRFHSNIGRHRSGEDSRTFFDDVYVNDEEIGRPVPPPPPLPIEREKYRYYPKAKYDHMFMHDPVLDYKEVMKKCSVVSNTESDSSHVKSVEEDLPSLDNFEVDFEANFETNFDSAVDSVTNDWPGVSDLVVDPATKGDPVTKREEELVDEVFEAEDVRRIAESVAEDISENIKNKVCHRGNPF